MDDVQELQLHIKVQEAQEPNLPKKRMANNQSPAPALRVWQWRVVIALSITFLMTGASVGTLLGRYYYDNGGNSKWMATLVQTAGFPLLVLPLFFFRSSSTPTTVPNPAITTSSTTTLALLYLSLGLLIAFDNMMYSYGLLYLPVSTYSLICATQLAFNVLFSFFLNSQKLTPLILNSAVLLTFSAALLAVHTNSAEPTSTSTRNHVMGFICTLVASAMYSLLLCLMQLFFQKILKKEDFLVVLETQIYTAAVATCVCIVGIFASGDWKGLKGEMERFEKGTVSYVMTLVWTAVSWQVSSIGCLGLIFVVSSLFSNVISTLSLPVIPILAVIFFHDKMDGMKVMAMLLALWGFLSYIYQHYLDGSETMTKRTDISEDSNAPA